MKKKLLIFLIVILFSLPSIIPLLHKGFFQSDDGEWMVIRTASFYTSLKDWQFPVRYLSSLNYGYGYPVANFLYPGFMYMAVFIHLLGFGFIDAIKIILGLSMVGSSIFVFLWLSRLFNKFSAFIGAMFYLYLPYHLYDIYKRGSVGEILALAIVPFILWQIERKSFFLPAVGIGMLVVSHNTLALLFIPIMAFYMLIRKKISIKYVVLSLFLGLGSSAFFSIPAILDLQYTIFSKTKISDWSGYFSNLDTVSYLSLIVVGISLVLVAKNRVKGITPFFLILGLISIFLATSGSTFLWRVLPISFIQFPFRLLSIEILAVSYLACFLLFSVKNVTRFALGVILLLLLFASSFQYRPSVFFDKGDSYYSTNEASTTVKNEYLPTWVKNNPSKHYKDKAEIIDGKIYSLVVRPNSIVFDATSPKPTKITINTIYFPGWKVFIDSNNSVINYNNEKGLIKFDMPAGIHRISAYFLETPIRLGSDIVSAVSALILLVIVLIREMQKKI